MQSLIPFNDLRCESMSFLRVEVVMIVFEFKKRSETAASGSARLRVLSGTNRQRSMFECVLLMRCHVMELDPGEKPRARKRHGLI